MRERADLGLSSHPGDSRWKGGFQNAVPSWGIPPWGAYPPEVAPEAELSALRDQAQWLREQLDAINKRIEELEKEA